ncbi:unnamed protein product [Rhizophagus irregularis]|uniref:Serine-threonine/tyrosine-protein kinase catalytic domain-containing protein n=1 Tax=Rhizophagus irregularis TaxID=588596 RepID=A0A916E4U3_9GLOM|nr:unnamed protein product [Rhizophagus irregularis]CAB5359779.1 unnamed protein product [Rhizophagus irregularis]
MSNNNNINKIQKIVNELKFQRDVNFHVNIIRYYGITKLESDYWLELFTETCIPVIEEIIPNTPNDYSNLYIECWNDKPNNRPSMHKVVDRYDYYK